MKVEWHEQLSVGVEEIDQQHKLLINKYNSFFKAYSEGRASEEVFRLFGFLEAYVVFHFADEERLQQRIGFPDYLKHRQQHRELIGKIAALKERIEKEGPDPNLLSSVGLLMTGWLIEHINVMDSAIGRFQKEKLSQGGARIDRQRAG